MLRWGLQNHNPVLLLKTYPHTNHSVITRLLCGHAVRMERILEAARVGAEGRMFGSTPHWRPSLTPVRRGVALAMRHSLCVSCCCDMCTYYLVVHLALCVNNNCLIVSSPIPLLTESITWRCTTLASWSVCPAVVAAPTPVL